MIKLKNVSKYYYSKGIIASGFSKVNLELSLGEFVAITGESGSGKSTLINVLSGLDSYEDGEMYINGHETSHYLSKDWEIYRKKYIGNIYQNFNLINSYTVYQNIDLVLTLNGVNKKFRKKKVLELIKRVGLTRYKNTKVSKLSGGQKQRVAIARALAKDVPIIVADEPTGSLDKKSSEAVIKLLSEVSKDKLVIVVTHNYEQVEDYVTRKIIMHDGKILEDKKVKEKNPVGKVVYPGIRNLSLFDTIKLAFRNTYNVIPKFVLLFLVYAFMVVSLMTEYGSFKCIEKQADSKDNAFFSSIDTSRIIINKSDRSSFSQDELNQITNLSNVDHIAKNDLLIDSTITLGDENYYLSYSSYINNKNLIDKVDEGRLPEADDEIVIEGVSGDYYLTDEEVIGKTLYLYNVYTGEIDKNVALKVVGIRYSNNLNLSDGDYYNVYVSDSIINRIQFNINQLYSTVKINFMANYYTVNNSSNEWRIQTSDKVPSGNAYISDSYNNLCYNENCIGSSFSVEISNIYYSDSLNLNILRTYNKDTLPKFIDITNYNKDDYDYSYEGIIYVNTDDYNSLYNKDTYQVSVFVKDDLKVDSTANTLNSLGYNTYKLKDLSSSSLIGQIYRIMKIIVTIIVVVVLFFISYFIIKLIMKSRNTYFAIIRMLGGSKLVVNTLISLELFFDCSLAYIFYFILLRLYNYGYITLDIFSNVNKYFGIGDYLIIYILIIIMSFLISQKYVSWLFKDTAMNVYREDE